MSEREEMFRSTEEIGEELVPIIMRSAEDCIKSVLNLESSLLPKNGFNDFF